LWDLWVFSSVTEGYILGYDAVEMGLPFPALQVS
jgi:hypothetical protein